MRRLIFLWFVLALLLMAGVLLIGITFNGPVALEALSQHFAASLVEHTAFSAVDAYESGGAAGLAAFSERTNPGRRLGAWLLNDEGRELSGAGPPPPAIAGRPRDTTRFWLDRHGLVSVVPARAASGRRYTLLMLFAPRDFLLRPELWSMTALRVAAWILGAALACSWLAGQLSRPLLHLREATRRFASGELATRAGHISTVPEIRQLASDFDHMADQIQSFVDRQEQLLQHMSHELRTPLTRLGLQIDAARRAAPAEAIASVVPYLDGIEAEAGRLNSLVGRILRYSRLRDQNTPALVEPIALGDFLESIVADAEFEAAARGRRLELSSAGPDRFQGDRELLRSAIENPVRNALRFAPEGTAIEITRQGGIIRIRDHGPGVPPEKLPLLFEPFQRISERGEGFGLGLAISRRAIQIHAGDIAARNAPGGGLEVEIRLPAGP